MKKSIKLLSVLFSLILMFSFVVGCSNSEPENPIVPENPDRIVTVREFSGGVHDLTAPEREDYFVKDGVSEYAIVAPKLADQNKNYVIYLEIAIQEFNDLLFQATGTRLPVIYENSETTLTHNANQKYISIGSTKLLESAELPAPDSVLENARGYRIITKDNNVYMYGSTLSGDANSVYGFFRIMFNYEIFDVDYWHIDTVKSVKMRDFAVNDKPDAYGQQASFQLQKDSNLNMVRFNTTKIPRMYNIGDYENGETEKSFHNFLDVYSKKEGVCENAWFSDSGDQLCFSAHGDEESLTRMVEHGIEIISKCLMKNSTYKSSLDLPGMITLTCEDVGNVCTCAHCKASNEQYGGPAGLQLIFMNRLMEGLIEWMETPGNEAYRNDNLILYTFAYAGYETFPGSYDETTKSYKLSEGLEIHPRVGIYLANNFLFHHSVYSEMNDVKRENFIAWADNTDNLLIWTWDHNFRWDVSLWDTYNFYTDEYYSLILSTGFDRIFFEVDGSDANDMTGFQMMKMYIQYNKMWDSTRKVDDLKEKWFDAMFGVAADKMWELFESERLFERTLYYNLGALNKGEFLVSVTNKEYWSLPTIKEWVDIIEQAHAINERVNKQYNPEEYARIKENIDREYVYPAYATLTYFGTDQDDAIFYKKITDYLKANDNYFSSQTDLADLVSTYRNA